MDMIPMDEAISIVLANTQDIPGTDVSLMDALGRTLAADIRSDLDMPPFDKSAMDGYAVVGSDVESASAANPVRLEVVEEIPAGTVPRKSITVGKASRITTGAPIPKGADTVVIVEETQMGDDGRVSVLEATEPGRNVVPLGEDVRTGQKVLSVGTTVRPPEIGILAAMGAVTVPVLRQPVVGVVATGGEIVEPDCRPEAGQIRNSNGYSMSAQVTTAGASPRYLGIVEDRAEALRDTISKGLDECDIVMLSGGVSAGVYDLVQGAMQDCGVEVLFDRILMKPGKPLTFGIRGEKLIFGLPGNPVSSVVGFELLVRPCIRKMQGMTPLHLPKVHGRLKQAFEQRAGRKQFVPACTTKDGGDYVAEWVGHHGSADLFSFSRANSLFVIEADVDKQPEGSVVEIILLEAW
jgi:molybdopterin molybdotransferase